MKTHSRNWKSASGLILVGLFALFFSMPLLAQQTGEIFGKVTDAADGSAIAEVGIQATGTTLPGRRSTTTNATGDYRLPLLPPGEYTFRVRGSNNDGVWNEEADAETDLQLPWGLKLLSGGPVTRNVGYYFYFYMSEAGEVVNRQMDDVQRSIDVFHKLFPPS